MRGKAHVTEDKDSVAPAALRAVAAGERALEG